MEKDWFSSFLEKLPIKKEWLPSKKLILIFGGIGFLWLSFSIVVFLKDYFFIYKNENGSITVGTIKELKEKDTDGDGLFDWQENFLGTDINNKDTDGDGIEDGEEINKNKHPLIEGPDDNIVSEGIIYKSIVLNDSGFGLETTNFINDWFEGYLDLQEIGSIDEEEQLNLIDNLLNNVSNENLKNNYNRNYINDINIFENESKIKAFLYKEKLLKILETRPEDFGDYDLKNININEFINDFKSGNFTKFEEIKLMYRAFYGQLRQDLIDLKVPQSIAQNQINLINILNEIIEMIDNVEYDPIKAIASVNRYFDLVKNFQEEINNIVIYLNKFGVYE